ncbi:MAG: T9SS type A sorting domain-containing protein [Bacteroidaceae bacterium]|nr:T9SS type A sorting domain-containing protein [Bacteroidaceae bacterium]
MKNFTLSVKVRLLSILLLGVSLSASAEGFKGTFFVKAAEFVEGAASGHGNVYLDGVEIVIAEADPATSWDLEVTNLCGQGVTYGGTLSDDGLTLTLGMLGNCYFSDRDYTGKGTESLGGAEGTIMGSLEIKLLEDGSLQFGDFTVISTILDGAPVSTVLATYKGAVAVPVTGYHFAAAGFTAGEASIYGNEYPAEFDFTLRRCIENDNYDVAVTNLCNQGTTFYATSNEEGTELTISNVAYAYFSEKDYTKGTESLGGADGTMMGSIVMTLQDDGSWAFTDFTVIRTVLAAAPEFTVLATYVGGKGALSETTGVAELMNDGTVKLLGGEDFVVSSDAAASLNVFDLGGRQVATGVGRVDGLASGIYIVRVVSGGQSEVCKLFVK